MKLKFYLYILYSVLRDRLGSGIIKLPGQSYYFGISFYKVHCMITNRISLLCSIVILLFSGALFSCKEILETRIVTISNSLDENVYYYYTTLDSKSESIIDVHYMLVNMKDLIKPLSPNEENKFEIHISYSFTNQTYKLQLIGLKESTINNHSQEELIENNIHDYFFEYFNEDLEKIGYKILLSDDSSE